MNAFTWSGLLTGISCTVMAGLVYLTNRTQRANQLWAVFCLAVSVWGFGALLIGLTRDADVALVWWRVANLGAVLIPVLFYHFVAVFTGAPRRKNLRVCYVITALFAIADLTPWFVAHVRYAFNEFYYHSPPTILYPTFVVFFMALVLLGHRDLWRFAKQAPPGASRTYAGWLLFGTSVGFLGGGTCFLPVFGIDLYPYGNFMAPLFPLIMTYGILRYRLIDVDLAVVKGSSFLLIYAVVAGLPFVLGWRYRVLWQAALGSFWWVAPVVLMGLLASLAPWLYIAIQKQAETKLLGDRRGYQRILWQASQGMTQIRDLQRLLRLVVHVITKTVGLTNASIFLEDVQEEVFILRTSRYASRASSLDRLLKTDPLIVLLNETRQPLVLEKLKLESVESSARNGHLRLLSGALTQMKQLQAAAMVPSFAQDRLVGFVVLGTRRTGQGFSDEDVVMFSTLANQSALAIENARFYEEDRQRQAALFHAATLASLGTMASSMGHQVNNRFNVVSVIASTQKLKLKELLQRSIQEPEAMRKALVDCLEQFDSLQEEAVRGGQIFTAIRKIARPSTEGHKRLAIKAAIQAGIDIVQYKVRFDRLDFQLTVPSDLPEIMGDVAQLGECFLNLIDNSNDAIKIKEERLHPEGYRGKITVVARAVTEGKKPWIVVDVSDNGIGMTDKERERLFIPFFTTKATAEKGTGLGLYVINKIIKAHKGIIAVASTYEGGTTFTIRLPAVEAAVTS